jgi:hypothetical protein
MGDGRWEISDFGFRISDFEFRISNFEFRISDVCNLEFVDRMGKHEILDFT